MLLRLSGLLDADEVSQLNRDIVHLNWQDGAKTAGPVARAVKHNLQADLSSSAGQAVHEQLRERLLNHEVFCSATQPARLSPLIISKTQTGGGYGAHVDNAFMGQGLDQIRTDISFTLFLSDPESYEGGELVIDLPGAREEIKLAAGDLVLYPSTSLHAVAPVHSGKRIVCVGWVESRIPEASDRELVFDLVNLKAALADHFEPQSAERLMVQKLYSNLLRRLSR